MYQEGSATVLVGDSSVDVVFDPPMAATPTVLIRNTTALKGLDYAISGLTKDGFTLTLSGRYMNTTRIATFTAAGGLNQNDTYTHSSGIQSTGIVTGEMTADAGSSFRLREGSTTTNSTILSAPAAPAVDVTIPWSAFW